MSASSGIEESRPDGAWRGICDCPRASLRSPWAIESRPVRGCIVRSPRSDRSFRTRRPPGSRIHTLRPGGSASRRRSPLVRRMEQVPTRSSILHPRSSILLHSAFRVPLLPGSGLRPGASRHGAGRPPVWALLRQLIPHQPWPIEQQSQMIQNVAADDANLGVSQQISSTEPPLKKDNIRLH